MLTRKAQLIVSGACGVLAAALVFAYTASVSSAALTQREKALERYGGEQVEVVVAARDIGAGEAIEASDIKTATWIVDLLPASGVVRSSSKALGSVAQADIGKGEVLTSQRLGTGHARISVPAGLEAVSVSSDDVLAVGGAIQAGSFVDVYVEDSSKSVVLLGTRVLVLETSAISGEESDGAALTWVTLAVTEDSVADLISAAARGTVHLALPGDQGEE